MKAPELRTVHDKWLWHRARALETKLLKKYGKSLTAGSISNRFNKCIVQSYVDEPIMEINDGVYREICKEIEKEYAEDKKK